MILTCPNCGTQYAVKDGAIPLQGRQVRCASCRHSWHQDPEGGAAASDEPGEEVATDAETPAPVADQDRFQAYEDVPAAPEEPVDEEESFAEATLIAPRTGPEAEERAFEEAVVTDGDATGDAPVEDTGAEFATPPAEPVEDWREPPESEAMGDEFAPFQEEDEIIEPRRRWWPLLLVLLLVAALSAAFWFAAPAEWKARIGMANTASPLALVTTHMDRQRLESGNELLTVTGRVINPTGQQQAVPPLTAELRTRAGKVVYRWTIAPPAPSLAPGASASFNSAEVNVPPGGDELTITLGKARA
jgi:predicted Zn finger-like uncharacterized protein